MTSSGILDGIKRMYAIWGWAQQEAFDFCIPMVMPSNLVSAIFVQVKNKAKQGRFDGNLFSKIIDYAESIFENGMTKLDCIYVVMSFYQAREGRSFLDVRTLNGCLCIHAEGYTTQLYPFILGAPLTNQESSEDDIIDVETVDIDCGSCANPNYGHNLLGSLLRGGRDFYASFVGTDEKHEGSKIEYIKAMSNQKLTCRYIVE